jgi:hypothetical protein
MGHPALRKTMAERRSRRKWSGLCFIFTRAAKGKLCYTKSMTPWRERLTKTAIIAVGVILILAGMLVWALLFFRATL